MDVGDDFDQVAHHIAVAGIRRKTGGRTAWSHTVVGELHPGIMPHLDLAPGELTIASGFFSDERWWAVTTRRITSRFAGETASIDPRFGVECYWGNMKNTFPNPVAGRAPSEIGMVVSLKDRRSVHFEYQTLVPAMAPVYACGFWQSCTRFHYRDLDP